MYDGLVDVMLREGEQGYPNRHVGLAAFYHDSQQDWLHELKELIAMDIPVIVLMHFLPNGTNDGFFILFFEVH
jgi:hypothetical protein